MSECRASKNIELLLIANGECRHYTVIKSLSRLLGVEIVNISVNSISAKMACKVLTLKEAGISTMNTAKTMK